MAAFRSGRRPSGESLKIKEGKDLAKTHKNKAGDVIKKGAGYVSEMSNLTPVGAAASTIKKAVTKFKEKKKDKQKFTDDDPSARERLKGDKPNFRSGGTVCKLATKGKGRAYGKNS